ncbi:MAG: hypothetical protein RL685_6716 [Pseudomonadota bacterium]|jgi:predicted extracellular nuclease
MGRDMPGISTTRSLALLASGLGSLACGPLLDPLASSCRGSAVDISELQGTGNVSPRLGELATVEGIVTLLTVEGQPSGFFLQSPRPDSEPLSSEGLFVQATEEQLRTLAGGQAVRVRGRVAELGGVTALSELELVEPCSKTRLTPARVELGDGELVERWESMSIRSTETWTLLDTAELERTGRVLVSPHGRSYAAGHPLGQTARPRWALSGLAGSIGAWLSAGTVSEHLRLGARAQGLSALVVAGAPPLLLAAEPNAFHAEPAPAPPVRPAHALRVAALNLDNYFSELGSRGADSELELERQRAKLASVLLQLDADILALSELGNSPASSMAAHGASASLTELLDDIAAAAPDELEYRVSASVASPEGTLRSAIAYRGRQLRATGDAWFASDPAFRRAPLLQRFESAGGSFTLVVVHLKSKVCSGAAELVGPEGCGAEQRLEEARALLRVLSALPAAQAEETLVLGDFNSDVLEAPLRELRAGGLLDLFVGLAAAERYSYVFEGEAVQLDHALAGATLAARLRGAHIWHINADEPALLGYELSHPNRAYTPDPRRSSDHDPIVVDLAP